LRAIEIYGTIYTSIGKVTEVFLKINMEKSIYTAFSHWLEKGKLNLVFSQFTGLNPSTSYSLTFFASKLAAGRRVAQYKMGTSIATLEALDNVNNVVTIAGVTPAADGTIEVEVKNNVTAGYFHLGVIELEW
jgi:hypothetical protein